MFINFHRNFCWKSKVFFYTKRVLYLNSFLKGPAEIYWYANFAHAAIDWPTACAALREPIYHLIPSTILIWSGSIHSM